MLWCEGSHLSGVYDTVAFYTHGFGYLSGIIKNSVAWVDSYTVTGHSYSWVASWYHTNAYLYDCGNIQPQNIGGCYMNSDVSKSTTKVRGDYTNIFSSQAYTKTEMNTQSFVNELNIYSRIQLSGQENWYINDKGQLALRHGTDSGINKVATDEDVRDSEYYTLQGIKVNNPKGPGIYIVKNGITSKKVLVR